MEYFENLNLRREPFSSSPDPDMFYRSASQMECLRHLEIAIRLRRGLNVVLGAVGSGKTTICRQLFRELGHGGEIDPYLVLDPGFDDPADFILHLARTLGTPVGSPPGSPHELMENIKSHLFDQGVIHQRIVCLVIDEGQKINPACLEILRELLNYETNEFKLLQIVIFAQIELMDLLLAQPNLGDRVNYLHTLAPFRLRETRDMIAARLRLAAVSGAKPPRFTAAATLAAHLKGEGYPRRIVRLCHKALLAIASGGRKTVTAMDILRGSETQMSPDERKRRPGGQIAAAGFAVLVLALIGYAAYLGPDALWLRAAGSLESVMQAMAPDKQAARDVTQVPAVMGSASDQPDRPDRPDKPDSPVAPVGPIGPAGPSETVKPAPETVKQEDSPEQSPSPAVTDKPAAMVMLGRAAVPPGWNLTMRLEDLYGRKDEAILAAMAAANPDIEDIAAAPEGTRLAFPGIPAEPPPSGTALISVARVDDLEEGFAYLRAKNSQEHQMRLLAYAAPGAPLRFEIVLARLWRSRAEAEDALPRLPDDIVGNARIISAFTPGTTLFTALRPQGAKSAAPRPKTAGKSGGGS